MELSLTCSTGLWVCISQNSTSDVAGQLFVGLVSLYVIQWAFGSQGMGLGFAVTDDKLKFCSPNIVER